MKYTLYHFRRIQGAWFNHGAENFAATKREARAVKLQEREDHMYIWLLSDTAPKQVGCGPCGRFMLQGAV